MNFQSYDQSIPNRLKIFGLLKSDGDMQLISEYFGRKNYQMNVETFLWNMSIRQSKFVFKKLVHFTKRHPNEELAVFKTTVLEEKFGNVSDGFHFRIKFSPIACNT